VSRGDPRSAEFDGRAATGPALTVENLVKGTPAFIAPELALGGAGVDAPFPYPAARLAATYRHI